LEVSGACWCRRGRSRPRRQIVIPWEGGGSSTPRPVGSITVVSGILGHPPSRVTTTEYAFAISRHVLSEVCISLALIEIRGRREDRVRAAPAVSRANAHEEHAHEHTGSAETLRPSLRSGFTAYNVISPENGSFASVATRTPSRDLTPAPRRQDHTTSPYASCALVYCAIRVHRIPPRVRDDREPPLVTGETRGIRSLICPTPRAEYFRAMGWTARWCPMWK
jgi:hypothetical protein